ncbi:uncharacterized protein LOC144102085 [Amblyomma americanum]
MPDSGGEDVRRVTVSVPGVNWRPTRFAESELQRHACSLCRLVPQSTLLLPCSHALCDSCHAGSIQDGAGACPLDWEPFDEADCQRVMLHARKANTLKAFCWNQGCDFVGALPDVLRHFEQECSFHVLPCPRCGEDVLHRNLPMHCKAECVPSSPSTNADVLAPQTAPFSVDSAHSAVAELRGLLEQQHEHELPALQSGMKEILEQTSRQSLHLQEISRELTNTEQRINGELKRVAKELSASFRNGDECQTQSHSCEMTENSASEGNSTQAPPTQMPWHLEQKHILRKLEIIANESFMCLQNRHRSISTAETSPNVLCELIANPTISEIEDRLYVSPRRSRLSNNRCYRLNVQWTDRMFSGYCSSWDVMATASRWHRWDTHLTVAVGVASFGEYFQLHLRWHGTLGAPYRLPYVTVTALHPVSTKSMPLNKLHSPRRFSVSAYEHADTFGLRLETLKEEGFFANGQLLRFDVAVED